jgi:DNA polymerase-3 subunit alpha
MLLVADVETTGLPPRRLAPFRDVDQWPRIVSIAWALFSTDGTERKRRYAIVKPHGFDIPADSVRVHGITTDRARREGVPLAGLLEMLNADLRSEQPGVFVAHNVAFDRNVVLAEMVRAGAPLSLETLPTFCTMEASVDLCRIPRRGGGYKWPSLAELHRHLFGCDYPEAHDAAADVAACARCYFALQQVGSRTAGEEDEDDASSYAQELIDRILVWAADQWSFDTSFVEDMQDRLNSRGCLTPRQLAALENIVDRWHIDD